MLTLFLTWFQIGILTFGGGYAMLPMIQKLIVEKYHWATEEEIMDYYAIGQVTPGVIAVNTATFVGYHHKGVLGGIVATLGVVSPSLIIISIIAGLIANFSELAVVQHALSGVQLAVCVLMFDAVYKLWKKNVSRLMDWVLFLGSFLLAYFTSISTVWLVIAAALIGLVLYRVRKGQV